MGEDEGGWGNDEDHSAHLYNQQNQGVDGSHDGSVTNGKGEQGKNTDTQLHVPKLQTCIAWGTVIVVRGSLFPFVVGHAILHIQVCTARGRGGVVD